jgi:hypothetical protein
VVRCLSFDAERLHEWCFERSEKHPLNAFVV